MRARRMGAIVLLALLCCVMPLLGACTQQAQVEQAPSQPAADATEVVSEQATAPQQEQTDAPATDGPEETQAASSVTLEASEPASQAGDGQPGGTLIAYFTWSPSENTGLIAELLAEDTGAELLRLEPAEPYPTEYQECTEVAREQRDQNARPALANAPESLDAYDTIVVGYPIWWQTAPMLIGTFLESYDLTGKQIYLFSRSQSMDEEQFAQSVEFIRSCAPGAVVQDGLFVRSDDTDAISQYAAGIGAGGQD